MIKKVSKIVLTSALLLGVSGTYASLDTHSHNFSNSTQNTVNAKTLSEHFTVHKSAKKKSNLPKSIHYSKRVKKNKTMHITYSGTLKRKSIKKSGNKYVATYSGTLNGHWS